MSERYSRLFSLPENLYVEDSPVIVAAGTLLKDEQTGRIVAQLKLRSIAPKRILAAKVRLELFDTARKPIGEVIEYDYLDINAQRDDTFGQKNPISVAEKKARSYRPAVTEVVFDDMSVWTGSNNTWEALQKPKFLNFSDPELTKQYKLRFGKSSTYQPTEERGLWYCTCGGLNHIGEDCHACGNSLFVLQSLDLADLNAEKNARLAMEEQLATQERAAAKAKKEKNRKIFIGVISAIAVIVLIQKLVIPLFKYNNAVSKMEAGQYEEAIMDFESMEGFWDSEQHILSCQNSIKETVYQKAVAMMAQEAYDDALAALMEIEDYKDCRQLIAECKELSPEEQYKSAVEQMNSQNYENAKKIFEALNGYKDSQSLIQKCDELILEEKKNLALKYMDSQKYSSALTLFKKLQDAGMDVAAEIQQCEMQILESGTPFVTSGIPTGKETTVSATALGGVKLHKLTIVNLDNECVRFTLDCTIPQCDLVSFFDPPKGNLFMYIFHNVEEGRQTFTFRCNTF